MKARMKVTIIVPNTVDAYVSGILIDDDLTNHYNFRWNGWTAFGCFKTSQRDAEVVTICKNWDVKSAFDQPVG